MIRVILADDEKWSLIGLKRIISWESEGFEIVGTAENGIEALELCRRLRPDILFTDIRMPGMDGLELTRAVALEMPAISVMLITGFGDLSYAQQAIRLGAIDFLTKQVTAAELLPALRRYKEKRSELVSWRTGDLYFSYFSSENTRSIQTSLHDLCVSIQFDHAHAMTCYYDEPVSIPSYQIFIDDDATHLLFQTGSVQVTIVTLSADGQVHVDPDRFGMPHPAFTGCSRIHGLEERFYLMYRESTDALMSARLWNLKQTESYEKETPGQTAYITKPLLQSLMTGNTDKIPNVMEEVWQNCRRLQVHSLAALMDRIGSLLAAFGVEGYDGISGRNMYSMITAGATAEDLHLLFIPAGRDAAGELSSVNKVLRYIDEHFMEDLRIADLACAHYINASYLSTMIRKKTGCTYSEIILGKRMELAKKLLAATGMSAQDIADKCGYRDYSHFNSLFKRCCGCTPGQYRQKNQHIS